MRARRRLIGFVAAAGLIAHAGAVRAQAERIVSLNLCTDQLVMLLADRANIASVSYTAADGAISAYPELAQGLAVNHALTEEVLAFDPDLVISSTFSMRPTEFLLDRLGHDVIRVPTANSIADIRRNIEMVAQALGVAPRGRAVLDEFDAALAAARGVPDDRRPLAAFYWANGFTSGAGTLPNTALNEVGFRTLADRMGVVGVRQIPLEALLMAEPDVLVISVTRETPALANQIFQHPAIARMFGERRVMSLPNNLFNCGTPAIVEAYATLSALRREMLGDTDTDTDMGEGAE